MNIIAQNWPDGPDFFFKLGPLLMYFTTTGDIGYDENDPNGMTFY